MSEIDDIFSGKNPKITSSQPPTAQLPPQKKKRKDKKKTRSSSNTTKADVPNKHTVASESKAATKRPAPETVVDPSLHLKKQKINRHRSGNLTTDTSAGSKKQTKTSEKGDNFTDSRGTVSRKTTEEGWAIYKEDELGIGDIGGDTDLCPFDCQCCF